MKSADNVEVAQSASHTVIEALYDLPLGGTWNELQSALCRYWALNNEGAPPDEIQILERHFERALSFLERLPAKPGRWLNELYRMPVPACVFDASGELLDANAAGKMHLGFADGKLETLPRNSAAAVKKAIQRLNNKSLTATTMRDAVGATIQVYLSQLPQGMADTTVLYLGVIVTNDLPTTGMQLLAEQFHLTPSEADLCLRLSAGASLDVLVRESNVKKTTLRTHLANCFSKLGVSSQPELVALVLHSIFAGAQLNSPRNETPVLTPYLDPEVHGYPKYSKFQLNDGRNLGFFEYGDADGIPALYLHGSLDTGMFTKSQRLTGNGVRLITVERGGVGESTPNPDPSPAAYAKDLLALVDHLGLTQYVVIGRSMGSWDAVSLVLADPNRAKLLVLTGGRLPVTQSAEHQEHSPFYRSLFNAIWHSNTMGRLVMRTMQVQIMTRGVQSFLSAEGLSELEAELIKTPLHLRHLKSQWMRSACHGPDPLNEHLKLYKSPVADPPWQNLPTPTLLIHGEEDQNVPLERLLRQTDSFRDRKVIVLPGVGHMLVHVAMGEVLRIIAQRWAEFPHG
jgi:pimeloyl-ACP methyl ester carboxylesterase/DNA-binding CsgD family transcriptional regulator